MKKIKKGISLVVIVIAVVLIITVVVILMTSNTKIIQNSDRMEYQNDLETAQVTLAEESEEQTEVSGDTVTIKKEVYENLINDLSTLKNDYEALSQKVESSDNGNIGRVLYENSAGFKSGNITVENFEDYTYVIAICDWGWAIPLYKNADGYMYGIGGRGGKTSSANEVCLMGLTLSYSGNTITYVEGKWRFVNGSSSTTNLTIRKIIGIF